MNAPWAPGGRTLSNPLLLAAGIDRSGAQAAHLLSLGFGGVEFGTVTPHEVPHRTPAARTLAYHLAPLATQAARPLLGANLGLMPGAPQPLRDWVEGVRICAPVADYLVLNLSAETARPLLDTAAHPALWQAVTTALQARDDYSAIAGRKPALALKLPLDADRPTSAELAAAAGIDALVCVLSDPSALSSLSRLHDALRARYPHPPALLAVGGLRRAADVQAALAAGAVAVQVHSAYIGLGPACVDALLGRPAQFSTRAPSDHTWSAIPT